MTQEVFRLIFVIVVSVWASIYIGSLAPKLWRQKNYRGAIGVTLLACCTLILPTLLILHSI